MNVLLNVEILFLHISILNTIAKYIKLHKGHEENTKAIIVE